MKFDIILFTLLLLGLYSCQKSGEPPCPAIKTYTMPTFYRPFNFKPDSKWIFKNSSSGIYDTIIASSECGGFGFYQQFNGYSHGQCATDKHEYYNCPLIHKMFSGTPKFFSYSYYTMNSIPCWNIFQGNIGDSVKINDNSIQYMKIENIFPTFVINGNTFNNVYQMYYYPNLQGFKRLWWCPSIGIVQCEFVDTSNVTENWAVTSYSVQLY
jgi:hypothetical protein